MFYMYYLSINLIHYYLLFIIYYLLFIIYYLLFIIYYLLFIIYYLLFIIFYLYDDKTCGFKNLKIRCTVFINMENSN